MRPIAANHRMSRCGVGANGQNRSSTAKFIDRVGHRSTAECGGQTGHSGSMSETCAMIDIVGSHYGSCELLKKIVFLICTFGRGYGSKTVSIVL